MSVIVLGCLFSLGCGTDGTQMRSHNYAAFSDNPLPVRQGEEVIWDEELPALQIGYWSDSESGVIAARVEATMKRKAWLVSQRQSTAEVLRRTPNGPPTLHRLSRITLTGKTPSTEGAETWSQATVNVTNLAPPFGCGVLVTVYREDHWRGWAREFHGFLLPWKAMRAARVVTNSEAALVTEAVGAPLVAGPVVGGGPHEPLENPDFSAGVQQLAVSSCRP